MLQRVTCSSSAELWLTRTTLTPIKPRRHFVRHSSILSPESTVSCGKPLRVAIVGSGPAGFYTANRILNKLPSARIDMFERLPVPFGLVRFGVAPDHEEVKSVRTKFHQVGSSPNFKFYGNVNIGEDISLSELEKGYNAIVYAYGASKDKLLNIPGEKDLRGIYSAGDFVGWYNGLPKYRHLNPILDQGEDALVIGNGNVSLDVARILLSDVDKLRQTDISEEALETLSKSRVKSVRIVGRRGPLQAAFTTKEIRELLSLKALNTCGISASLLPEHFQQVKERTPRRLAELLAKYVVPRTGRGTKTLGLDFMKTPHSFLPATHPPSGPAHVSHLRVYENKYIEKDCLSLHTAKVMVDPSLPATMVPTSVCFRSIGYKGEPLAGMQEHGLCFKHLSGTLSHYRSRVRSSDIDLQALGSPSEAPSDIVPGHYCAGWVKKGPNGQIVHTMEDAYLTADSILHDWYHQLPFLEGSGGWDAITTNQSRASLHPVSWADFLKIDALEVHRGLELGKPRLKMLTVEEMLEVATGATS